MQPATGDGYLWPWSRPRLWLTLLEWLHYLAGITAILISGFAFILPAGLDIVQRAGQFGAIPPDHFNRLVFGLFGVAYGIGTCYSASSIGKRVRREFSTRWAFAHLPTVVWAPLAVLTWVVLMRESVKQIYAGMALPFSPLIRPPPLPVKVIPLPEDPSPQWTPPHPTQPPHP